MTGKVEKADGDQTRTWGKRLTAMSVKAIGQVGRHSDGGGLYLSVSANGGRRWVFLFRWRGKLKEMGLGSARSVTLAQARAAADKARAALSAARVTGGALNPLEARREAAREAEATVASKAAEQAAAGRTFGDAVQSYLEAHEGSWRNEKHRAQWRMTLTKYAAALSAKPVADIATADVLNVLRPLWSATPETASRLRGRIEAVLDAARARGDIAEGQANPARWRGHLETLLPKRARLTRGHHAAMPYKHVPEFIGRLREAETTAALALEFTILTAARSGETLGARWKEFDLEAKVWTIPGARMKAGREHRVPLSARACAIVETLASVKTGEFVFASRSGGGRAALSGMAMGMALRRMEADGDRATVHGFRSAFRDWAGNETEFPRELAEEALAHAAGDATERAYRRGDALERRRRLMDEWAGHCEPSGTGVALAVVVAGGGRPRLELVR